MGTINYRTSDYITIGLKPYEWDDYKFYSDTDGDYRTDYDQMNFDYECDFENIQTILNKYDFHYFHVAIKPGYYEGFSIDIENNYGLCYDSWQDKRETQKEVTQLKKFLLECIDNGLCQVFPGWCTGYATREDSIAAVKKAMKDLRDDIRFIPTWYYCEKMGIEI